NEGHGEILCWIWRSGGVVPPARPASQRATVARGADRPSPGRASASGAAPRFAATATGRPMRSPCERAGANDCAALPSCLPERPGDSPDDAMSEPRKDEPQIRFDDGAAYEGFMGGWSRLAGEAFLHWLAPGAGGRWVDVGCGNG